MPNIEVRGKYRTFRYDGDSPLDFTTYNNLLCVIRRPNINTFVTLQQYVPGQGGAFTTFQPGSSYTIVTRADGTQGNFNFDMGTYTRVDRLPASTLLKSPNFYIGLDKNSIAVPISSYALSVNTPLSSIVNIVYINGQGNRLQYVYADNFKTGAPVNFTHFLPNSGYELRNRIPFTFFAPLQSEMGDAYALGNNTGGEYGMGYRKSNNSFPGDNIFGNWDKIVFNNLSYNCIDGNQTISAPSIAALSSCGTTKALFVLGNNVHGQLGTGSTQQYYPVWTRVPGQWLDVEMGRYHMLAINSFGRLCTCGDNTFGQLGRSSGIAREYTLIPIGGSTGSYNFVEVAATGLGNMARDSNGFLYACGSNREGKLGVGNNTSIIYTFTREALSYTWTSVKAGRPNVSSSDPSTDYFVAIRSNNTLYGVGTAVVNSYFGSTNTDSIPYTFKQESLNFTDVTNVITTIKGTFIQRRNQNNYFAAGNNSSGNPLAIINNNTSTTFLETYIPFDAIAVANYYNLTTTGIGTSYIRNSIRYSKTTGNSFTANTNNYNNIFTDASTIFTRRGLQPTPTPSITPTRTPTPTPTVTPTVTPMTLVPTIATNAVINSVNNGNFSTTGDKLYWYYSSNNFTTFNRTLLAYLPGNRSSPLVNNFSNSCFDFKDNDNLVVASMVRPAPGGNYVFLKQTIRNRSTWNVSETLNDIGTNSTQIAAWNGTDYTQPFFSAGANTQGVLDMFVHRNSNTAVYVFTQIGSTGNTYSNPFQYGVAGAWSFTVNLANNEISNAVKISNENLAFNMNYKNASDIYVTSSSFLIKTGRPLTKLPDGRIIFKSLYKVGASDTNYGAVAKIGYYNQATWNGFTDSIAYEIPGTSGGSTSAPNNIAPLFCEFAALGNTYYLAWCTMTNAQANNITFGTVNPGLVLRNLQTGAQVNVDSSLNTASTQPSLLSTISKFMHPFDIIAVPSLNRIYVVYTKFTNFVGNYESRNNTFGIFLKRYDTNLNLIDTSTLFTYIPNAAAIYPSLNCPKFSFNVSSTGVLTLILCFAYNQNGAPGNTEFIMTNTPSIDNIWSTVLNRTGTTSHNLAYINRATVCL